jgi:serine protease Do
MKAKEWSWVAALLCLLAGAAPARADTAPPVNHSARDSLVYLVVEYTGYVQIPAQYGGGTARKSRKLTADLTCSGFVVDPAGYIATAGQCVDPEGADGKDALRTALIEDAVDHGELAPDKADELLAVAYRQQWPVEGRDPGSPVARRVEVVQPDGPKRVIKQLVTAQVVNFEKFDDGDNALLKVSNFAALAPLTIATSAPAPGTPLTAAGFPGSIDDVVDAPRLKAPAFRPGIASSRQLKPGGAQGTEISAKSWTGMSGGPTVDDVTGQVLGTISYDVGGQSQALNFTDPAALRAFLLKNGVRVAEPALPGTPHSSRILPAVIGLIVVATTVLVLALVRKRRRQSASSTEFPAHGCAGVLDYPSDPAEPAEPEPTPELPATVKRNSLGVSSAVLGVISMATLILCVGPFFGVGAVTTGSMALRRVRRGEAHGRGAAIAGVVLGALSILLAVVAALGLIALFFYAASEQSRTGCWPTKQHAGCY